MKRENKTKPLVFAAFFAFAASALFVISKYTSFEMPAWLLPLSRWLLIASLVWFAALKRSLTTWIFVAMAAGLETGLDFPGISGHMRIISMIFLRLIKTIIAPLIFATLVTGIAGHSSLKQVGRMGIKALIYFEVVTTLALFIGLGAINLTKAGVGISLPEVSNHAVSEHPVKKQTLSEIIMHVFPENIAKSVAEGEILQIVVFSILFAIALALLPQEKKKNMLELCSGLAEVMFKFTNIVMYFAPVGVGAAMAYTVGHMGLGILLNLFKLLATLYAALAFFLLFVLLPIALIAGIPVIKFLKAIIEPVSIAFATTSSEAALPRAMEAMEAIGVPRPVVAFVMPTGYSFNLDGSTLYLSLASVFVAQAAGVHMSFAQQMAMVFTLMLTSKGVAGVPRATLVILLGTAASFNLPVEPIFIILGIDELMDMARTSVNVIGNCLATAVIAKWEGVFESQKPDKVILEAVGK